MARLNARSALLLVLLVSTVARSAAFQTAPPPQEDSTSPSQAPSTAAPQPELPASPAPVKLDSGEPFGLALKGGVKLYTFGQEERQAPRKARIEWGMLRSTANDMLKPPAGSGVYDKEGLSCTSEKTGAKSCFTNVSAPWTADFGDSFQWSMEPFLQFTHDDKFYGYHILFHGNAFEDTKKALLARLGKPKSDSSSTVENRMGAKFDQEIMIWETAHTLVIMMQRSPANLTKSALSITYKPLEKSIPPEPTAAAPF